MKFQARKHNIVMQTANNETMIYDLDVDKAYLLNETSAFVWQLCDGNHDLSEISRVLAEKMNQQGSEDIVKLAIDALRQNNLLDEPEKVKDFFSKTSRRKAIKQIGLATMIALPIIYSLTAPAAAHAASGRVAVCQTCTGTNGTQGNCAPGLRCVNEYPITGRKICSSDSGRTASPSGYVFNSYTYIYDASRCNAYGAYDCCKGTATFTAPNTCRCN